MLSGGVGQTRDYCSPAVLKNDFTLEKDPPFINPNKAFSIKVKGKHTDHHKTMRVDQDLKAEKSISQKLKIRSSADSSALKMLHVPILLLMLIPYEEPLHGVTSVLL